MIGKCAVCVSTMLEHPKAEFKTILNSKSNTSVFVFKSYIFQSSYQPLLWSISRLKYRVSK